MYGSRGTDNAVTLRALLDRTHAAPPAGSPLATAGSREWSNRGRMLLGAHAYSSAFDSFSRSLRFDATDEPALTGLIEAAGASGRLTEAQQLLESLSSASPRATEVRNGLARLLAAMGSSEQAAALAGQVIGEEPDNPKGPELLASILADAGDLARLAPLVARMQQRHGAREETLYYAAMVSFLTGNFPETIVRADRVVESNPRHVLALNLIGSANASLGQRQRARESFQSALAAGPQEPSTYANLGQLELESGNRDAAVGYFLEALTLDPGHEAARAYLSSALGSTRRSTP
jgi:tetratricopeptide (TPR) repeat protein